MFNNLYFWEVYISCLTPKFGVGMIILLL